MKTMKTTKAIEINDHLTVQITVTRTGQQSISMGDGVVVEATISLPADADWPSDLTSELCFGTRLSLAGEQLRINWGFREELAGQMVKSVRKTFGAKTWRAAFKAAFAWAEGEVAPLVEAVAARAQALIDAEKEEE